MKNKRRAKIVATIGPASQDKDTLMKLIDAGMNVARLNFSHGDHETHAETFNMLRNLSKRLCAPLAIMQDLQGVKIRVGEMDAPILLTAGETVTLTTAPQPEEGQIPVDFPDLHNYLKPAETILLDDGSMELTINRIDGRNIQATVVVGGLLKPNKGINLPGSDINTPGFTEKDEEDLIFGLGLGVDAVAVSFVRTADDIARVKRAINRSSNSTHKPIIIAKLERPQALDNLDEIIEISDGVMVARGDLGVEMSPEAVPIIQKQIIEKANLNKKIVITATQMLDSMINNPRPTRAEATDVANAIFDGTDGVMLSGETAIGKYPIQTIEMMSSIVEKAEQQSKKWGRWQGTPSEEYHDDAVAITCAARELAHDLNVSAVVVFTQSGRTARLMSKANPSVPIIGFTPQETTYNRMSFYWGVYPHMIQFAKSMEEMLSHVDTAMSATTPFKPGQQVVVISGFPVGSNRLPNLALLHTIGASA
jgi:pyruvate kinase